MLVERWKGGEKGEEREKGEAGREVLEDGESPRGDEDLCKTRDRSHGKQKRTLDANYRL